MKVLLKNDDGTYYASKVFGIINKKEKEEYHGWEYEYIVFNKEDTKLITKREYAEKKLDHIALTYDSDTSDLDLNKNYIGKAKFLSNKEFDDILNGNVSEETIKKCKKYIIDYKDDYVDIKDDKDINNLMEVFYGFHDAYVDEISGNDKELKVIFKSCWGCNLEMIFTGNVFYKNMRTEEEADLWWLDATIILDGHILLVDYEGYDPEKNTLDNVMTYFSANHAKYKIIPTFKNDIV